jgi:nucleoid-associated protein YgaU
MPFHVLRPLALTATVLALSGCVTPPAEESAGTTTNSSERSGAAEPRKEAPAAPVTATEAAVAERRSAPSSGGAADMAKLVDQLNEAARELATLRTANAKLRAERERPRPAPAVEPTVKTDPAEERLAASLKSFGAFKQEMTALIAEVERLKKASSGADAELKAAGEQMRQAKAALARVEEDLRVEKRLRQEAEANAGQLRDQLRTIAKAMSDAGLSADKLASSAEGATSRSRATTRPASKYVVREGDTLMKIADRVYGDTSKWRVILEANRGRVGTDGTLEAGVELEIPRN